MIGVSDTIKIHNILIDRFGGTKGIRDLGALEASLARPYATFDGNELYPTPKDKAASVLESIVINHPFVDGNKRIGYVLMRLILLEAGFDIEANQDDKYKFVISVTKGEMRIDGIKNWLAEYLVKK